MTTPQILKDLRRYAEQLGDSYLVQDMCIITDSIDADYKGGVKRVTEVLESGKVLPGSAEYRSLLELREAFENRWKIRVRKLLKEMKDGLPLLKDLLDVLKELVPQVNFNVNLNVNIDHPADGKPPKAE